MKESRTQVAVLGVGAVGAMTLWRLAARGIDCLGFEQFEPGHDRGSSTGDTRIFRTAYFEGAAYVPLLQAALPLWRALEGEARQDLLTLCGALMIGAAESEVVAGARRSAELHGLPHELLDNSDLRRRQPRHALAADDVAVLDPQAGYVRPEVSIAVAAAQAGSLGARIASHTRVDAVEPSGSGGWRLQAGGAVWEADSLVLAGGAWNPRWAAGVPLAVERVVQAWWPVDDPQSFSPETFPVFIRQTAAEDGKPGRDGLTRYGIPSTDGRSIKVAGHGGGREADPDALDREVHESDWQLTSEFVRERLRGVGAEPVRTRVCMYTNTPDEHFAIGEPPELPGAILISACSGHGFKFAPVLGEIAARMATGEAPGFDLEPFSPRRFAPVP